MTTYKPCTYRVSAKAAIATNKGLLLVKEDSEYWDLPGGGIEHLEDPQDALRREVQEEIGTEVSELAEDHMQAWATYDHSAERPLMFLVYKIKTTTEPEKSPQPDITISYFTKEQLRDLPIEPHLEKFRQRLIDFAQ